MKKLYFFFGILLLMSSSSLAQSDETWIDLDGVDDYMDLGLDTLLSGKNQFTVEVRVHFDNSIGDYTIIGQRTSDVNRTIVMQRWAGGLYIFVSNTNYGTCSFIPCEAFFYHLAIVYDGSGLTNDDRLKFFINGVRQTLTFTGTIDVTSYVTSPAANLVLGCEHNGPSTQLQFMDGQFGEYCVWNYPLTDVEISNRVLAEVAGNETGLVEYFKFNNGSPGGNNTGITSFTGGNSLSTITPTNMAMNGTSSNFVVRPTPASPVDVSTTANDSVITANAIGASYQWLDCDNSFAVIPGETSQSFEPASPGNFAVEVTEGSCIDTSTCVPILNVGIVKTIFAGIDVYPNPIIDKLIIQNNRSKEMFSFELLDARGRAVIQGEASEKTIVPVSELESGVYFLRLKMGDRFEVRKTIKN